MDPKISAHAAAVLRWRESLSTMSDHHFFELIRMYIGEVKTPYNKQKLIEELSSFIRREDNKKVLVSLLSENDCIILAAVRHLPLASQEKLASFFSGTYTFASLYEQLMNLEERLLIYRYAAKKGDTPVFLINPLLAADLQYYSRLDCILPSHNGVPSTAGLQTGEKQAFKAAVEKTDPLTIGAVLSFISGDGDIFKADGSLKKKIIASAASVFPRDPDGVLFTAAASGLKNLGLLRRTGDLYSVDRKKCALFAQLSHEQQCAYIAAAVHHYFPRETMYRRASLLLKTISCIPSGGYSKKVLIRAFMLMQEQNSFDEHGTVSRTGRFASILERGKTEQATAASPVPQQPSGTSVSPTVSTVSMNVSSVENFIQAALVLGLLETAGYTDSGEPVYVSSCRKEDIERTDIPEKSLLRIDAGFSLTVMPGIKLQQLLPLLPFCRLVQCDRVCRYEITRSSCMKSFDEGYTPVQIFEQLKKYTPFELPQSLVISVEEWFHNYSSASLYQGFILHVSPEKQIAVENNKILSPHIVKIIAAGVYLLDFASKEEAASEIERSSLDFIGAVKNFEEEDKAVRFVPLENQNAAVYESAEKKTVHERKEDFQIEHTALLAEKVEQSQFTREQKEGLISRIHRRIILNEAQLRPDSVKAERTEASGMDFLGKVHVVEAAYATGCMAELVYDDASAEDGLRIVLGIPSGFEKTAGDTLVKITAEPEHEIITCSIGSAKSVKRIRGPIFREIR